MLKIGEFSKLSYISIRMLRYYDKLNLLKPSYIEEENGYRFYKVEQLETANKIQKLKTLGFNTDEMKEILDSKELVDLNQLLKKKKKELQQQIENIKKATIELEEIQNGKKNNLNFNVIERVIPKRNVISLRKKVSTYMDEGILWNELGEYIDRHQIKILNEPYAIAIYHDKEHKEENVDIEVQLPVKDCNEDSGNIRFYKADETEVISATFYGSYDKVPDVIKAIANYALLNKYEFTGLAFNIFYVSPSQDENPNNWITETCYEVKK